MALSAGMNVISTTKTLRIPMPENIPKTLMDTMSKTINEKNPQDATMPAVSMTGPIFTIESITAWRFAEMLASSATILFGLKI